MEGIHLQNYIIIITLYYYSGLEVNKHEHRTELDEKSKASCVGVSGSVGQLFFGTIIHVCIPRKRKKKTRILGN